MYKLELKRGKLRICYELNAEQQALREDVILDDIASGEFADIKLDKETLKNTIATNNTKLAAIKKGKSSPESVEVIIGEAIDARLDIIIREDKMSAHAEVVAPQGGDNVTFEQVKQACIDAGIRFGLKTSLVNKVIEMSERAEPGQIINQKVAIGKPATNGKNARLVPKVELFAEKMRNPNVKEDGKVDLKDLGNIDTVAAGTVVLEKVPLTEGENGRDVFGDKLEPIPGEDCELVATASTKIHPKNPNLLIAAQSGIARFNDGRMEIDDTYVVSSLDPKEGHVKFKGSVIVQGDVAPEMELIATGDVLIGGFVESAIIKCGGELTILSGASGRLLDDDESDVVRYSCILSAGGQINLAFANQCEISCKKTVVVKKQVAHCDVTADALVVGDGDKPNGQITGGSYYLCKGIDCGVIGTESNVKTEINLNRTYDIFIAKEAELAGWIDGQEEILEKLETKYNSIMDPKVKEELEPQMQKAKLRIRKYNEYRSALIDKRRQYMEQVNVKINKSLFPKVTFHLADRVLLNEDIKGPSVVKYDDFKLVIEPLV